MVVSCVGLSFGWICLCLSLFGCVGDCICYFDIFGLVNTCVFDVLPLDGIDIEFRQMVDGFNMVMALIIYIILVL